MLFVQEYLSISQIEPEFIGPLEELCSNILPNFQWAKIFEGLIPHWKPYYYLFFCQKHNRPIGLAQINLIELPQKGILSSLQNSLSFILKEKEKEKILVCEIFGSKELGYIFEPTYQEAGIKKLRELINKIIGEQKIVWEKSNVENIPSSLSSFLPSGFPSLSQPSEGNVGVIRKIPTVFFKKFSSYEEYVNHLPASTHQRVKQGLELMAKDGPLQIKDFDRIHQVRETFPSLPESAQRSLKFFELWENTKGRGIYLGVQLHNNLKALLFLTLGKKNNLFFTMLDIDSFHPLNIDANFLMQIVINNFFDAPEFNKLRPLFLPKASFKEEWFLEQGFLVQERLVYNHSLSKLKEEEMRNFLHSSF